MTDPKLEALDQKVTDLKDLVNERFARMFSKIDKIEALYVEVGILKTNVNQCNKEINDYRSNAWKTATLITAICIVLIEGSTFLVHLLSR